MAWAEWKEVLLPGTQRDRHGNRFTFTRRDIRQADRNVGRMLSRGVPIPCVWEHVGVEAGSSDARKAAYARFTFGEVAGRRINGRGALELRLTGRDPKDREQLLKTRFVSPKVCPGYSDSRGGEYRGTTVAHVAATPTPVQFWQRPFGAELSRGRSLYLSFTPEERAMADDANGTKTGGGAGGGAGGKKTLQDVIDALREKGFNIPDEVTDETGLVIAIKAGGGAEGGADDLDLEAGLADDPEGSDATTQAGGAPMLMSDDRAAPLRKSSRRELDAAVVSHFNTGRIDRPTALDLRRKLRVAEFSYTNAGDMVPNELAIRIRVLGKLKPHTAWKPNGHVADGVELSVTEIDHPDLAGGNTAETEAVLKKQDEIAARYSVGGQK